MIERPLVVCIFTCALAACHANDTDLKQELAQRTQELQGKVYPLPLVRFTVPLQYEARGLPDPFYPVSAAGPGTPSSGARRIRR